MLLLLPLSENLSWRRLPWVTFLLILSMGFVFFFFQLDDKAVRAKAKEFYFSSNLHKIELPMYIRFARRHMHLRPYYNVMEMLHHNSMGKEQFYWLTLSDPLFQQELKSFNLIQKENPLYLSWVNSRRTYEYWLEKDHVHQWGLKTAQPSPIHVFSSFFLHGSLIHLIGNMIFLLFIGLNLEVAIGSLAFLGSILLLQGFSISIYSFFYPFTLIPLVGASGVIAGLIGIHAMLFNVKKLDFFVNVLFYFNTIRLPALIVLPLWLGWELIDYSFLPNSLKAYHAHIGGFIGGILIGILLISKKSSIISKNEWLDITEYQGFQRQFEEALNKIGELNFPVAKQILFELNKSSPNNHDVLFQLFNVTKMDPASEDYHKVVAKIFHLKDNSKATVSMINIVFKNYIKRAEPSIRFDATSFLALLQKFRKYGYLEDAEKILKVLIQQNRNGKMDEMLAREQLLLARCFFNKSDILKAKHTLEWCKEMYPKTASAREAKKLAIY